jgi:hypothetical protein
MCLGQDSETRQRTKQLKILYAAMNVPIATNTRMNSLYTEYMLVSGDRPTSLTKLRLLAVAKLEGSDRGKF